MTTPARIPTIRRILALLLFSPSLLLAGNGTSRHGGALADRLQRRRLDGAHAQAPDRGPRPLELVDLEQLPRQRLPGSRPAVRRHRRSGLVPDGARRRNDRLRGQLDQAGGSGRFTFTSNPEYLAALKSMGYGTPDADEVFSLAVQDSAGSSSASPRSSATSAFRWTT